MSERGVTTRIFAGSTARREALHHVDVFWALASWHCMNALRQRCIRQSVQAGFHIALLKWGDYGPLMAPELRRLSDTVVKRPTKKGPVSRETGPSKFERG